MEILNEAKKSFDYRVRLRRHLHENPEITSKEYETLKYISAELDAIGIEYKEIPDGGIIARVYGGRPGKTVLLRADMDALPITENPRNLACEKVCISKNDGVSQDSHADAF